MSNVDIVTAFCAAWDGPKLERVLAMLSPDIVYHNMPLAPIVGIDAVEVYLGQIGPFDACSWELRHIAGCGDQVLTERIDRMTVAGKGVTLPVMGIFELQNGMIRAWRDYFDLALYRAQWPALSPVRETA